MVGSAIFDLLIGEDCVRSISLDPTLSGSLKKLPEGLDLYFDRTPESREFEMQLLVATRVREDGVLNANKLLTLAREKRTSKRAPIKVRAFGSRFAIVDGNSTFVNAKFSGWSIILAELIEFDGAK